MKKIIKLFLTAILIVATTTLLYNCTKSNDTTPIIPTKIEKKSLYKNESTEIDFNKYLKPLIEKQLNIKREKLKLPKINLYFKNSKLEYSDNKIEAYTLQTIVEFENGINGFETISGIILNKSENNPDYLIGNIYLYCECTEGIGLCWVYWANHNFHCDGGCQEEWWKSPNFMGYCAIKAEKIK